jgi:hypothetical protein
MYDVLTEIKHLWKEIDILKSFEIPKYNRGLFGADVFWDDLRVSGSAFRAGVTAPTLGNFLAAGGLKVWRFETGKHQEAHCEIQMPHNWKEGTDIHPHVHWVPCASNPGNVVWELEYSWQNINGTFAPVSNMAIDATAAGGTAWVHKLSVFKTGGVDHITGTGKTISSMLVCRIHRNAGAGSDTYAADVGLLEFDIHYQIDSLGSRQEYTK